MAVMNHSSYLEMLDAGDSGFGCSQDQRFGSLAEEGASCEGLKSEIAHDDRKLSTMITPTM